jgi:hypothetical protein
MALTFLSLMPLLVNNRTSNDLGDKDISRCVSHLIIEGGILESFNVPCGEKIRLAD